MGDLVARSGDLFSEGNYDGYRYQETVLDGVTSNPIKVKPTGRGSSNGTVVLICGAGTGKVQTTIDSNSKIDDDSAVWVDWDQGEVTGTVQDVFVGPISAIRVVSISGSITFNFLI